MVPNDEMIGALIRAAMGARELSYSPYSHFRVGAAVLCSDGAIFCGANIENASYPVSLCAERAALACVYAAGRKKSEICAVAVCGDSETPVTPCGMCRQALCELVPETAPVFCVSSGGSYTQTTVAALLPNAFSL